MPRPTRDDFLLDPEVLQGAWRERVQLIVDHVSSRTNTDPTAEG